MSKIIFTNGCFDILHRGHLETLRYARELAGEDGLVFVGVNTDASVRRLKGRNRPIMRLGDRMALLKELRCVDHVYAFAADTPKELIAYIKPDIVVKGGDYLEKEVVGRDLAEVRFAPLVERASTTSVIDKILSKRWVCKA